jgi:hypothetical protein
VARIPLDLLKPKSLPNKICFHGQEQGNLSHAHLHKMLSHESTEMLGRFWLKNFLAMAFADASD